NQPAPGVLSNDTDPESDPIHTVLGTGPTHAASFTLNADGSFSYTHDGSETTSDGFTYFPADAIGNGNLTTVNITITPVNDPPALANAGSIDSYTENGAPIVVESAITATDPDNANLASAT